MLNPNNYTVGWICALVSEFVAAQAMLDEFHGIPDYASPNDINSYALGKIGPHNVVIAVLPHGRYGTVSAAAVARSMVHSFPNVRVGFMVGIGGGAPNLENDVRLGDVVVGSSVFQFNVGKAVQGQMFEITKTYEPPPPMLRVAVGALYTRHKMNGHRIQSDIDAAFDRYPRIRHEFGKPGLESDNLFRSDTLHSSHCAGKGICRADPSKLVRRPRRSPKNDDPFIHYGVIASSDMLMKDAIMRDDLAKKKKVICFEMEAAGLVDHFPCLVIRGICDYSDSHKNKMWQGYAAMTAAAYAKDLLRNIPPGKVAEESRILNVLSEGNGLTPLMAAVQGEWSEVIELLVEGDASENSKDARGTITLHSGMQENEKRYGKITRGPGC
ncbi:nucleoside phosphorylase domain-containing protein [Aspergillus navahoensis]